MRVDGSEHGALLKLRPKGDVPWMIWRHPLLAWHLIGRGNLWHRLIAKIDRHSGLTKIRGSKRNGDAFLLETGRELGKALRFFLAANGKGRSPGNRGIEELDRQATGIEGLIRFRMVQVECCAHAFLEDRRNVPAIRPHDHSPIWLDLDSKGPNRFARRLIRRLDEFGVLVQLIGSVVSASHGLASAAECKGA